MNRTYDLTQGNIRRSLILFSLPLIAGNLLQQMYNVADTMIVGQFLGSVPLAAVGSAYTLMTLLTSILIGCAWEAAWCSASSMAQESWERMRTAIANAFLLIALLAVLLEIVVYCLLDHVIRWLNIPPGGGAGYPHLFAGDSVWNPCNPLPTIFLPLPCAVWEIRQ